MKLVDQFQFAEACREFVKSAREKCPEMYKATVQRLDEFRIEDATLQTYIGGVQDGKEWAEAARKRGDEIQERVAFICTVAAALIVIEMVDTSRKELN